MKTQAMQSIMQEIHELHSLSHQFTASTKNIQDSMQSLQSLKRNVADLNEVQMEYKRKEEELSKQLLELREKMG